MNGCLSKPTGVECEPVTLNRLFLIFTSNEATLLNDLYPDLANGDVILNVELISLSKNVFNASETIRTRDVTVISDPGDLGNF